MGTYGEILVNMIDANDPDPTMTDNFECLIIIKEILKGGGWHSGRILGVVESYIADRSESESQVIPFKKRST